MVAALVRPHMRVSGDFWAVGGRAAAIAGWAAEWGRAVAVAAQAMRQITMSVSVGERVRRAAMNFSDNSERNFKVAEGRHNYSV